MKQNLLKTVLFSAALVAGTMGGRADNVVLQPTADTYLDWTNKTSNYGSSTDLLAGIWQEMWTNTTPGLKGYTSNIVLMKFNVKDYVGKMTSVSLSVTGTNNKPNTNARSIYLGYFDETSWDENTITAENSNMYTRDAKKLNIHPFNLSASIPLGKTQTCTFSSNDLLEYLNTKADEDGNVSLVIYGLGQQCSVASKESDNKPVLTIGYTASELHAATFVETSGAATEVKVYSDEGCTKEVSASSLLANTTYYYVATAPGYEDYKGQFTVGTSDASISFTMVKKSTFSYSVNLVNEAGEVLKTLAPVEDAYEGMVINYTYPKYLTDETGKVTYVCSLSTFGGTTTASKEKAQTVVYKAYKGTAYFVEGESVISGTNINGNSLSSGVAVRGFDKEKNLITMPSAGSYHVTYAVCSNNVKVSRTLYLYANDKEIVNKSVDWSINYIQTKGTITESSDVALAKGDVIKAKGSDTNVVLDYVLLEKVGDAVPVTDLKYATYVSSANVVVPSDVKVYTAQVNAAKNAIQLTEIPAGTVIPAGTAVLVSGEAATYSFALSTEEASAITGNELKAATAETVGDGKTIYVLGKVDGKPVFALFKEGKAVGEGHAYIEVPESAGARFYSIGVGNGETTGINEVNAAGTSEDGAYYTLQGMKTVKPAKGVFIHNGKKVVIK